MPPLAPRSPMASVSRTSLKISPAPLRRMRSGSKAIAPTSRRCLSNPPNPSATAPCNQVEAACSGTVLPSARAHAASHPASSRPVSAPKPTQAQLAEQQQGLRQVHREQHEHAPRQPGRTQLREKALVRRLDRQRRASLWSGRPVAARRDTARAPRSWLGRPCGLRRNPALPDHSGLQPQPPPRRIRPQIAPHCAFLIEQCAVARLRLRLECPRHSLFQNPPLLDDPHLIEIQRIGNIVCDA